MNILILTPQTFHQSWPIQNDFVKNMCKIPPLSNAILKASLGDNHKVTVHDSITNPIPRHEYIKLLDDHDLVAISAYTPFSSLNNEITLRMIKLRTPDKPVVMGGHHANYYSERWINRGVDVVVHGEGEKTFPEIVSKLDSGCSLSELQGISFMEDGKPRRNTDREPMPSLDESPFPDFEPLTKFSYDFLAGPADFVGPVETSRGCPYKCTFCWVSSFWGARQRFKSVDRVIEEMKSLAQLGADQYAYVDDNFAAKPSYYNELFDRISTEGLARPSFAFIRLDTIIEHPETITVGAGAGLKVAYIGFESLDDGALDDYEKKQKYDDVLAKSKEGYALLKKLGIFSVGLFVTGFPGHEKSDLYSIKKAHQVCDVVAPVMYMPFVGTAGYDNLLKTGARVRDCFYHDRRLASFTVSGRDQQNRISWYYLSTELSVKFLSKLIKGSRIQKQYIKQQFKEAIKAVFSDFGLRHLFTTLILAVPWVSPEKKLGWLKKLYLSSGFIRRLANI